MSRDVSNSEDVLDSRDIIARIEELEAERADLESEAVDPTNAVVDEAKAALSDWDTENGEELRVLRELAEEASGSPDWQYGEPLIRDSYFKDYAQELAEDCGMIPEGQGWPLRCIDWDQAADELKGDYFSVDFDGVDYWIRS